MKKILVSLFIMITLLFSGCTQKTATQLQRTITVFAAASLTESMQEIGTNFEAEKGIKVTFNFAGSQALQTSLEQGADVDVIAYASTSYGDQAKTKGFTDAYAIFAKNSIIVCKNKQSTKTVAQLKDLAQSGVSIVAADVSVPVGKYFDTALSNAVKSGMVKNEQKDAITANIKSRELSVKDVVSKVQLGQADFGVVYITDITSENKDKLDIIQLQEFAGVTAEYPIATVKNSKDSASAQAFVSYVLSDKGKDILKKYNYVTE